MPSRACGPRRCRGVPSVVSIARLLAPEGCEPLAESPSALAVDVPRKTPPSQVLQIIRYGPPFPTFALHQIHRTGLVLRHPHPLLTAGLRATRQRGNGQTLRSFVASGMCFPVVYRPPRSVRRGDWSSSSNEKVKVRMIRRPLDPFLRMRGLSRTRAKPAELLVDRHGRLPGLEAPRMTTGRFCQYSFMRCPTVRGSRERRM